MSAHQIEKKTDGPHNDVIEPFRDTPICADWSLEKYSVENTKSYGRAGAWHEAGLSKQMAMDLRIYAKTERDLQQLRIEIEALLQAKTMGYEAIIALDKSEDSDA